MNAELMLKVCAELGLQPRQVQATSQLLAEGATVPFIARYRKEVTGSLDEVQIEAVRDRMKQLAELEARREAVLKSLAEQNVLSDALRSAVIAAETLTRLEDLYAPYRPKRKTRASVARERGLEPLAAYLLAEQNGDPLPLAATLVSTEREVPDVAAALAGARDILAEDFSDHADCRAELRTLFEREGVLRSEVIPGKEEEGAKFRDYFDWQEPVRGVPSHRLLAIRRGSQEGFLFFSIRPPEEPAIALMRRRFVTGHGPCAEQVVLAVEDSYKRLLAAALETEIRLSSKKKADAEAIDVFAANVRELLLASPLGQRRMLAVDPGFRTGCKTVVLDAQGKLLFDTVIYPGMGGRRDDEARTVVHELVRRFELEVIVIGNGTGSRETEAFVRACDVPKSVPVLVVSEAGASVYSASEIARTEFPDKDLTVRGAVSIGRRTMDPLAELVKIDPKSIGVGQYQHDVDQRKLKERLDDVVVSCVNGVGVELNTASEQLLSYVSGLNRRVAANIVARRERDGPFRCRRELLDIEGLGPKAFEQAAGFLRIRGAPHPLDASAVHPERYNLVERMARDHGMALEDMIGKPGLDRRIRLEDYISDTVGMPTLKDIVSELEKPGRDPRPAFQAFQFNESVHRPEDLKTGMKLPGIVTNVAAFGAFVDVGVHQDGLVHVSQLSDRFVSNAADIVKVGQQVEVTVVEVDLARKRIGLSMKSKPDYPGQSRSDAPAGAARGRSGPRPAGTGGDRGRGGPPRAGDTLNNNWFEAALQKRPGQ
jgi:protein Tex